MGIAFSEQLQPDFAGVSFYSAWSVQTLQRAVNRAKLILEAGIDEETLAKQTEDVLQNQLYGFTASRAQWHEVFTDFAHVLLPGQFLSIPSTLLLKFRQRRLPRFPADQVKAVNNRRALAPVVLPMLAATLLSDGPIPERVYFLWKLLSGADPVRAPRLAAFASIFDEVEATLPTTRKAARKVAAIVRMGAAMQANSSSQEGQQPPSLPDADDDGKAVETTESAADAGMTTESAADAGMTTESASANRSPSPPASPKPPSPPQTKRIARGSTIAVPVTPDKPSPVSTPSETSKLEMRIQRRNKQHKRTIAQLMRLIDAVGDALSRAGMVADSDKGDPIASNASAAAAGKASSVGDGSGFAAAKAAGREDRLQAAVQASSTLLLVAGGMEGWTPSANSYATDQSGTASSRASGGVRSTTGSSSSSSSAKRRKDGPPMSAQERIAAHKAANKKRAAERAKAAGAALGSTLAAHAFAKKSKKRAVKANAMKKLAKVQGAAKLAGILKKRGPDSSGRATSPAGRRGGGGAKTPFGGKRQDLAARRAVANAMAPGRRAGTTVIEDSVHMDAIDALPAEAQALARRWARLGSFDVELNKVAAATCETSPELSVLHRMLIRAKTASGRFAKDISVTGAAGAPSGTIKALQAAGGIGGTVAGGGSFGRNAAAAAGHQHRATVVKDVFPADTWMSLMWYFDVLSLCLTTLAPPPTWRPRLNGMRTQGWTAAKREAEVEKRTALALQSTSRALMREWLAAVLVMRLAEEQTRRQQAWKTKQTRGSAGMNKSSASSGSPGGSKSDSGSGETSFVPELAPVLLVDKSAVTRARSALHAQMRLLNSHVSVRVLIDWCVTHPVPRALLQRCGTRLGPAGSVSRRRSLIANDGKDVRGAALASAASRALAGSAAAGERRRPSHITSAIEDFRNNHRKQQRAQAAEKQKLAVLLEDLVTMANLKRSHLLRMQRELATKCKEGNLIDRWAFHSVLAEAALAASTDIYKQAARSAQNEVSGTGIVVGTSADLQSGFDKTPEQIQREKDAKLIAGRMQQVRRQSLSAAKTNPYTFMPPSASLTARLRDQDVAELEARESAAAEAATLAGFVETSVDAGFHLTGPGVVSMYERVARQLKTQYTSHRRSSIVSVLGARGMVLGNEPKRRGLLPPPPQAGQKHSVQSSSSPDGKTHTRVPFASRQQPSSSSRGAGQTEPSASIEGSTEDAMKAVTAIRNRRGSVVKRALASAEASTARLTMAQSAEAVPHAPRRRSSAAIGKGSVLDGDADSVIYGSDDGDDDKSSTRTEDDPFAQQGIHPPPSGRDLMRAAEAVFKAFDAAGEGLVDHMELIMGMARFVEGSMEDRLRFLFNAIDEDGSGKLELFELVQVILNGRAVAQSGSKKRSSFAGLDVGGMTEGGGSEAMAFASELARVLDTDGDNVISRKEFITTLQREPVLLECLGDTLTAQHYNDGPRFDLRLLQKIAMLYSHVPHGVLRQARRRRASVDLDAAIAMTHGKSKAPYGKTGGSQEDGSPLQGQRQASSNARKAVPHNDEMVTTLLDRCMSLSQFKRLLQEEFDCPSDAAPLAERVFAVFDRDASGSVDIRELYVGMLRATRGGLAERAKWFFALFDSDESGTLDIDEIKSLLLYAQTKRVNITQEDARNVARWLDKDGNGTVTLEEWVMAITEKPAILRHVSRVFGRTGLFQEEKLGPAGSRARSGGGTRNHRRGRRSESVSSTSRSNPGGKRRFKRASSVVAAAETMAEPGRRPDSVDSAAQSVAAPTTGTTTKAKRWSVEPELSPRATQAGREAAREVRLQEQVGDSAAQEAGASASSSAVPFRHVGQSNEEESSSSSGTSQQRHPHPPPLRSAVSQRPHPGPRAPRPAPINSSPSPTDPGPRMFIVGGKDIAASAASFNTAYDKGWARRLLAGNPSTSSTLLRSPLRPAISHTPFSPGRGNRLLGTPSSLTFADAAASHASFSGPGIGPAVSTPQGEGVLDDGDASSAVSHSSIAPGGDAVKGSGLAIRNTSYAPIVPPLRLSLVAATPTISSSRLGYSGWNEPATGRHASGASSPRRRLPEQLASSTRSGHTSGFSAMHTGSSSVPASTQQMHKPAPPPRSVAAVGRPSALGLTGAGGWKSAHRTGREGASKLETHGDRESFTAIDPALLLGAGRSMLQSVVPHVPDGADSVGGVDGRGKRGRVGPHVGRLVTREHIQAVRDIGKWTAREVQRSRKILQDEIQRLRPGFEAAATPVLPPGLEETLGPAFGMSNSRRLRHRPTAGKNLPPVALKAYNVSVMKKLQAFGPGGTKAVISAALLKHASAKLGLRQADSEDNQLARMRRAAQARDVTAQSGKRGGQLKDVLAMQKQAEAHRVKMMRAALKMRTDRDIGDEDTPDERPRVSLAEIERGYATPETSQASFGAYRSRSTSPRPPRHASGAATTGLESKSSSSPRSLSPSHRELAARADEGKHTNSSSRAGFTGVGLSSRTRQHRVPSSAAALRARAAAAAAGASITSSGIMANRSSGHGSSNRGANEQSNRLARAPTSNISSQIQLQKQLAAEAARDWPAELRGDTGLEGILAEFGAMDHHHHDLTARSGPDRTLSSAFVQHAAAPLNSAPSTASVSSMAYLQSQPHMQSGQFWDERGSAPAVGGKGVASGARIAVGGGPLMVETRADRSAVLSRRSRNRVLGTLLHPADGIIGNSSATKAGSGHAAATGRDELYTPPSGDARLSSSLDMVHAAPVVPYKHVYHRQQPPRFEMSEAAKVRAAARSDAAASGALTARF